MKADPAIQIVVLPQASAGLLPKVVRTSPFPYSGAWLLAPQRLGLENSDRYHGSWIIDPNSHMAAEVNGADDDLAFNLAVIRVAG